MNTVLKMELNVTVGVTQQIMDLVAAVTGRRIPVTETEERAVTDVELPEAVSGEAVDKTADTKPAVKTFTEADVREAMHRCRQRIEGDDYKDRPTDDLHRQVTALMRKTCETISGQPRPSALPPELREAFIEATRLIETGVQTPYAE